jgi:hypothetical protein
MRCAERGATTRRLGQQDDVHGGRRAAQALHDVQAIGIGQTAIQHHHIAAQAGGGGEERSHRAGGHHAVPGRAQAVVQFLAQIRLVFEQADQRHGRMPPIRLRSVSAEPRSARLQTHARSCA